MKERRKKVVERRAASLHFTCTFRARPNFHMVHQFHLRNSIFYPQQLESDSSFFIIVLMRQILELL